MRWHGIAPQLRQLLPGADDDGMLDPLRMQARHRPCRQDVQLYYQLATVAARDVGLADTADRIRDGRCACWRSPGPADNAPVGAPGSAPPTTRAVREGSRQWVRHTGRDPAAAAAVRGPITYPPPQHPGRQGGRATTGNSLCGRWQAGAGLPVPRMRRHGRVLPQLDSLGWTASCEGCGAVQRGRTVMGVGTGHQLIGWPASVGRTHRRTRPAAAHPLRSGG